MSVGEIRECFYTLRECRGAGKEGRLEELDTCPLYLPDREVYLARASGVFLFWLNYFSKWLNKCFLGFKSPNFEKLNIFPLKKSPNFENTLRKFLKISPDFSIGF
jgi:hypothetical protein